ncbi:fructose-bisphosphatase class III [Gilvimarinus polysaccharolyticus]|uniref:fructose-bisphosphatase class III n=1 Tax=Gilvimarinus polysaccharolyticus TaxID=863921 RepID=UPI0006738878|nr:fructose-bisphosphatase class III [Gilvimarinus polysaccharolyticus]
MSTTPYKVFISDLHGQGDMFESLVRQRFAVVETLIDEYVARNPKAPLEALRHYLLGESLPSADNLEHFNNLTAMMEILLNFKQDRRFWPVGVETFSSCSWFLNILDEYAITGELDEQRREAIALLDDQDREQLCRYIAKAITALIRYRLYVVGDIYDRGPDAAKILEQLEALPSVSIQWGNHDVLWMGAASGSLECIATVVRLCLKYGDVSTLTEDYGICLNRLADLAEEYYSDDPCLNFVSSCNADAFSSRSYSMMHKAIAIVQFKLEQQIIERNPHFSLADRAMLSKVDFTSGAINLQGNTVVLSDTRFPTVNPESTSSLTEQEWQLIEYLKLQFIGSERLQKHINFLFANGGLLETDDGYTMCHGCLPVDENLEPIPFCVNDRELKGRALFDALELQLRKAYSRRNTNSCKYLSDIAWYLWCGPSSPLFGRDKMTTFERYFIEDKHYHREGKNPYFDARNNQDFVAKVAKELSGDERSVLINGHVPVKLKDAESPIYAQGQLICIDGGFAKAYRSLTGAAGMVLVVDSRKPHLFIVEDLDLRLCFHKL